MYLRKNLKFVAPSIVLLLLTIFFAGCGNNSTSYQPPDYSTVPAPYDTAGQQKTVLDDGLIYYTIEQGSGPFQVVERDQISVHYTGRNKATGKVFDSSYANGSTSPGLFDLTQTIRGFREGCLGMKIGAKRTIIVPPNLGYAGGSNPNLSGDTLVYDVKLVSIY